MKTISEQQLKQICRSAQKKVGLMVCDRTEKHYSELSRAIVESTIEVVKKRVEVVAKTVLSDYAWRTPEEAEEMAVRIAKRI